MFSPSICLFPPLAYALAFYFIFATRKRAYREAASKNMFSETRGGRVSFRSRVGKKKNVSWWNAIPYAVFPCRWTRAITHRISGAYPRRLCKRVEQSGGRIKTRLMGISWLLYCGGTCEVVMGILNAEKELSSWWQFSDWQMSASWFVTNF